MLTLKTYMGREIESSKAVKAAVIGLRQFWAIESPLKIIKNAFFSPQKFFLFLRYLNVCLGFLAM